MEDLKQQQQANHQEIARLAYQIWEQRGRPHGYDVEFWLEAERQIFSSGKPTREQPVISAPTTDAVAVQAQPSRTAAKQPMPRTAISSVRQTKPTPGAVVRP